jgi:hypothetical protein
VFWCAGWPASPAKIQSPSGQCAATCAASISTSSGPGEGALAEVLRRSKLDCPAAGTLHLTRHVQGATQEVDVLDPDAGGLTEPEAGTGQLVGTILPSF